MIRKALPSEIDEILALTKACAAKMASELIFQWNDHYPSRLAFENDVARSELYLLEIENSVAGCVTLSTLKDPEYDTIEWLTPDGSNLYVHRLAVHPYYQHQGWAKKIMDFAESYAQEQGFQSIRLDTFSKNLRNQRFYKARNYKALGEIYFPKQSEYPFYCFEKVL